MRSISEQPSRHVTSHLKSNADRPIRPKKTPSDQFWPRENQRKKFRSAQSKTWHGEVVPFFHTTDRKKPFLRNHFKPGFEEVTIISRSDRFPELISLSCGFINDEMKKMADLDRTYYSRVAPSLRVQAKYEENENGNFRFVQLSFLSRERTRGLDPVRLLRLESDSNGFHLVLLDGTVLSEWSIENRWWKRSTQRDAVDDEISHTVSRTLH